MRLLGLLQGFGNSIAGLSGFFLSFVLIPLLIQHEHLIGSWGLNHHVLLGSGFSKSFLLMICSVVIFLFGCCFLMHYLLRGCMLSTPISFSDVQAQATAKTLVW